MSDPKAIAAANKEVVKGIMALILECQVFNGHLAENEKAIKAALPAVLDMVVSLIEALDEALRKLPGRDVDSLRRIKSLTLNLIAGDARQCRQPITKELLLEWRRVAFRNAAEVNAAVDEYLCG